MISFLLFFKRDIKQIFLNPRLMILPLCFFSISLFLIQFAQISTSSTALYWVLFIVSTMGVLGQNIARDYDMNFLQALQSEHLSLTPYILSKALSLLMAWAIPFWIFVEGIHFFEGTLTSLFAFRNFVIILSVSGALGFLYCLFDTLFLHGKRPAFLAFILLTPFILPLLILSLLSLEQNTLSSLVPVIGYAAFLSFGAFLMTKTAIVVPKRFQSRKE